jgi:hypothetical protein
MPAHDLRRAAACGLLFAVLLTASAHALPVTLHATGSSGFDPADVAEALAAGAGAPIRVAGLGDGAGYFHVTAPNRMKGEHKRKPSRGTATWTLHVSSETPTDLLQNFCLVILGHDPNDPRKYKTGQVGLQIDTRLPWLFVTPEAGGPTYLAYALGDLEAGRRYEIPIEHRVGQQLERKKRGAYGLPRYAVAYLSLPEPSTLLLGLAAVGWSLRARRKR